MAGASAGVLTIQTLKEKCSIGSLGILKTEVEGTEDEARGALGSRDRVGIKRNLTAWL